MNAGQGQWKHRFVQDVLPALGMFALLFLFAIAIGNATFDSHANGVQAVLAPQDQAGASTTMRLAGDDRDPRAFTLRVALPPAVAGDARWVLWVPRDPFDAIWLDDGDPSPARHDFFRPSPAEGLLPSAFTFPVPPDASAPFDVVLHAQARMPITLQPQLMREDAASLRMQRNAALATMLYTGLFALALLAVGLFTAAHERVFLSLFTCAFAALLLLAAINGHLYTLPVVGLFNWWRGHGIWALALLSQAALLSLLRDMAQLGSQDVRTARAIRIACLAMCAMAALELLRLPPALLSFWMAALAASATMVLGVLLMLREMRQRPVMAVQLALLPLTWLGGLVRAGLAQGLVADAAWTRYGFELAMFVLLCTIGFVLIERVSDYRDERDHHRKARLDSERRVANETARASLTRALQSRLREQSGSDVQWTAFRLLLEYLLPQVPADLAVVIAHGYHRQDVLVVNPMPRKDDAETSIAPRLMSIKYQAMAGRLQQQSFMGGGRQGNELLVPIPVDAQAWGAVLLQREGGDRFDDDEVALANEFTRLTKLHIDETVATQALRRTAEIDALTGTLNRRSIDLWLSRHFADATEREPLALLFVDIDHFKQVNDLYGHACGDHCLRAVAEALRAALRPQDVLGRYGGEEFVAVLPGCAPAEARLTAERLREAVEAREVEWHGQQHRLTVSIGVGSRVPGEGTAAALLDRADQALYAAKHAGRNRIHVSAAVFGEPVGSA